MKNVYQLILSFFCMIASLIANAQTYIVDEGFEGEIFPPSEWQVIDADGDGHGWQIAQRGDATLNGKQTAISYDVDPDSPSTSYNTQNNYLITPKIKITNDAFQIAFKYCAQDIYSDEKMAVLISETGANVDDFTKTLVAETTVSNGYDDYVTLQSMQRSLAEYVGKEIYIAFVHKGGEYALSIEDVQITNQKGPKPITKLAITPGDKGTLSASLEWTNPSTDGLGNALNGLSLGIYRDGELITTIPQSPPGEVATAIDNSPAAGTHTYSVVAKNEEGESKPVSKSAWIGEDTPEAVADLQATVVAGQATVKWTAPTTGGNKGYIDVASITYDVVRNSATGDATPVATNIAETQFSEYAPTGELYSYTVVPKNTSGEGVASASNAIICFDQSLKDIAAGSEATKDYSNPTIPLSASDGASVSQSIYFPKDVMFAKGDIRHIVYKNSFNTATLEKPLKIWMYETEAETLSDGWIKTTDMTPVFDGNVKFTKGDNDVPISLTTPFSYTGKNLVVCLQMNYQQGRGSYFDRFFVAKTPDSENRTRFEYASDNIDIDGLQASDGDLLNAIPLTRFVVEARNVAGLSGRVTDAATGNAIANAHVSIPALGLTADSDTNGRYAFYVVPSGEQQISISAKGYIDYSATIIVQDGGEQTSDIQMTAKARISVSGIVKSNDTDEYLPNVKVAATGYSDEEVRSNEDGSFNIKIYANERYALRVEKPLYDVASYEINDAADRDLETVILKRSLIAPFGVDANADSDGSATVIEWKDPLSRTGRNGWTRWGSSLDNSSTSGDYSSEDYNVAHAFTAQDIADSLMVGQSILRLKAFIQANEGSFTAKVWKGTRDENTVIASKEIPSEAISPEGAWVTVAFDSPAEIREDDNYLIGLNVKGVSGSTIGCGGYGSSISGKNNLKWSDAGDVYYDGYYAWNISAYCGIPGADLPISESENDIPKCSYNVYRIAGSSPTAVVKLNEAPLQITSFTDDNWDTMLSDNYVYAVSAVYKTGESVCAYSNTLERSVDTDAGVSAFISPVKAKDPQTSVEVKVVLTNYGEKPLTSIPVALTVNGGEHSTAIFEGNLSKGESSEFSLGTIDVSEYGTYTIAAYTQLPNDEVAANDKAIFVLPNYPNVSLTGYRWDAYGYAGIMKWDSNIPEKATFVKEVIPDNYLINAGEYFNGRFYAYTSTWYSDPQKFVELDTLTWLPTKAFATDGFIQDMAYDYDSKQMIGLRLTNEKSELVKISLTDGATSPIGDTGLNLHALACNKQGDVYAISSDGRLYRLDKTSGAPTLIGHTGISDVAYLQSMAFDHNSGRLFWMHTGSQSQGTLYEVDPSSATVTPFGKVMYEALPSEIVALYSPYTDTTGSTEAIGKDSERKVIAIVNESQIIIRFPQQNGEKAIAKVFNMAGVAVEAISLQNGIAITQTDLLPGVYAVVVTTDDGRLFRSKQVLIR